MQSITHHNPSRPPHFAGRHSLNRNHSMNHRRSDYPQPTTPRIPQPPRLARSLTCGESIEVRIRTLLSWHAGGCGLIDEFALDTLARFFTSRQMTLADLRKLASHEVYCAVVRHIDECIVRKNEVKQ